MKFRFALLKKVMSDSNINKRNAILKYALWQSRRLLNLFPFECSISESKLIVNKNSYSIGGLVSTFGMYDYDNMNLVKILLEKKLCKIFFDIGANIGVYSLIGSETLSSQVYAFEPHPVTFALLQKNLKRNARNNTCPINKAVGNQTGLIQFTDSPGNPINSVADLSNSKVGGTHAAFIKTSKFIEVEVTTMAQFCEERNIFPELVKIDVEGSEQNVLEGFQDKLKLCRLMILETGEENYHNGMHQILMYHNLIGAYFFDFNRMTFIKLPVASRKFLQKDAVFINQDFKDTLLKNGFRVEDSH